MCRYVGETAPAGNAETRFTSDFRSKARSVDHTFVAAERGFSRALDQIGKPVKADAIKAAFDKSFGPGAGDRVKMSCRRAGNIRMISELTIGLSEAAGSASAKSSGLGDLIQGAGKTTFGCDEGVVDAAGF